MQEEGLGKSDAGKVAARFLSHVDGDFFLYLAIEPQHFRLARDWVGLFNTSLRSLDALHLAVASSARLPVVTADLGLAKSAQALGIEAVLLK